MGSRKTSAIRAMALAATACMVIHFISGWYASMNEAALHGQTAAFGDYVVEWSRDLFENLQSEFWQLAVQFAILAGLFRAIGVVSYEEDEEELRDRLTRIERLLEEQRDRDAARQPASR